MIGAFWNIRGLNRPGRRGLIADFLKANKLDFLGIQETKNGKFTPGFLKDMCNNQPFDWHFIPAIGSARGILVGCRNDLYNITVGDKLKHSVSVMIQDKKTNFNWMDLLMRRGKLIL